MMHGHMKVKFTCGTFAHSKLPFPGLPTHTLPQDCVTILYSRLLFL